MKPKQKPPTKRGEKKKHIHLVLPEQKPADQTRAAGQIAGEASTPGKTTKPGPAPGKPEKKKDNKVSRQIADELGETATWPRYQIQSLVWSLGVKQAKRLARKAKEIHTGEGMMIPNGTRQRTLGGVFFALCYSEGQPLPGRTLQRPAWKPKPRPAADQE